MTPPMVSTVRVNGNIDAAGAQLTQDMPDANAATDRRFARDTAPQRPRTDESREHDQGVTGRAAKQHPRARRVKHLAHDHAPPAQREIDEAVSPRQPRGQRDRGTFGVGQLIDQLFQLATAHLIEARLQLIHERMHIHAPTMPHYHALHITF